MDESLYEIRVVYKGGQEIKFVVTEFKIKNNVATGEITELNWKTPRGRPAMLYLAGMENILAILSEPVTGDLPPKELDTESPT